MNTTVSAYLGARPDPRAGAFRASPACADDMGVTALVPTYTAADGDRSASLRLCVGAARAAARQAGDMPLALLVVDNGLSPAAARRLGELLSTSGCAYHVLPAPGPVGQRYAAAQARNAGLAFLGELPADSPLRHRYLLFLDDDTAPAPDSLALLREALDARDHAIAACPRVVPVADLAHWLGTAGQPARTARTAGRAPADQPRRLAGPLTEAGYDLLSVTSHGSLVTGRTVGLLVRLDPVLDLIRAHGPLFYEHTPYGSSEDMLVMAVLSRLGELWRVPGATVADEARSTPGSTLRQQFAWGYDHAWLARALAEANLLDAGVHVLGWRPGTGWEHTHADWGACNGFLINPAELRLAHRLLTALGDDQGVAAEMFGATAPRVAAGTHLLGRVLARWQAGADPECREGPALRRIRTDLPPLGSRDWASMRDGMDALIGHVAGNAVGSLDNCTDPAALPPFFLYGARQPAAPPPA